MDLLSVVLTLRPERRASLPPRLGRASHAILLDRLAAYDADLATALHDSHGPKPYTCSDLMGSRQDGDVFPEVVYTLRYTALTAEAAAALAQSFAVGDTLTFESVPFTVAAIDAGEGENPWAGVDDYTEMAARFLAASGPAPRPVWPLLLAAPTAFKSQDQTLLLPEPELLFGSLAGRWNAFSPVALPEEGVRRFAEACVVVSRFSLRSAPGWDRGSGDRRSVRIGAIGKVTYRALNRDRYWLAVLSLLAAFARYSGVGIVTTMGMGQVRRL